MKKILALLTLMPMSVFAEGVNSLDGANTAWILTSTALVLLMSLNPFLVASRHPTPSV
jgi:Amt family ammonium transporter